MANKTYLDKSGLSYFWGKIKTALTGKQDSLVSGTNIKTINNTSLLGSGNITLEDSPEINIGSTTPSGDEVLWIDPNNMPSGSGSYITNQYSVATDKGYSANYVNNCNTYSTTETDTGKTWIDGKPIYRKVIEDTSINAQSGSWVISNFPSNVSTIVSCSIRIMQTGDQYYNFGPSAFDIVQHINGSFWVNDLQPNYRNRPATIIVEYTKTTD